ncbi:DNA mismatch repair protein MutS [Candidatus Roizmanbacteria bacterium]|nr:DNA mismatch repair protein MutS [Candidatus Roizmanbacteria bacterium]
MQQFTTPMMKQYQAIKDQYQDCLLFFRMGDFYELFMEDAFIGAKVLDITLTGRPKGRDGRIPMAGVPYHAVDSYLAKLVKAGYKVAICEQMTEPDKSGIVEREVIRVVTPGTVLDEKALIKKENNFLVSIIIQSSTVAIAACDISTGQFELGEWKTDDWKGLISNELASIHPSECILASDHYTDGSLLKLLKTNKDLNIFCFHESGNYTQKASQVFKRHFHISSLSTFGIEELKTGIMAGAMLLGYLKETQKDMIGHITKIQVMNSKDFVSLDRSTMINLELFSTIRDQETTGSLISVLDQTHTAMGGRLLREWIRKPLYQKQSILARHEAVETLVRNYPLREKLGTILSAISDIERILSRLSVGIGNARDMVSLKHSFEKAKDLRKALAQSTPLLSEAAQAISPVIDSLANQIELTILDEPAFDPKTGGIIKPGISPELDTLQGLVTNGKNWVIALEQQERENTGIHSLKVRFNKVFGFYIEVSNSNLDAVPAHYMRKQTLVNGERFITPELKKKEEMILTAEERMQEIEYAIFKELLNQILASTKDIQKTAQSVAQIDCLCSFAEQATRFGYTRPEIVETGEIYIKNGRHPVVERVLEEGQFVPNSIHLGYSEATLLMITGPNMAGKSVLMRQVALIALLNQIGSFVPAEQVKLSLVDHIFVRSGASDAITAGLSTFMVEMTETAQILHNATEKSLIVMDEIGRGTSTYDGISIAWAVADYLVTAPGIKAKTLFATHYHELQALADEYPQVKNVHMAIEQQNGELIFLHTLLPGGASHSFGVAVAKLAGLPAPVLERANQQLLKLESRSAEPTETTTYIEPRINFSHHLLQRELDGLDIHQMTPLDALNKLAELKEKLKLSKTNQERALQVD